MSEVGLATLWERDDDGEAVKARQHPCFILLFIGSAPSKEITLLSLDLIAEKCKLETPLFILGLDSVYVGM